MGGKILKKIILTLALLTSVSIPVFADNSNVYAPQEIGGGIDGYMYQNYRRDAAYEDEKDILPLPSFIKRNTTDPEAVTRREPHEIKANSSGTKKTAPMNYSQFPQNYDSSQQMFMMQNSMQQMYSMPY